MHWFPGGGDPGHWPINVYFERLDRIADIRELTEGIDPNNLEYLTDRMDRMDRRRKRLAAER